MTNQIAHTQTNKHQAKFGLRLFKEKTYVKNCTADP